MIRYWFSWVNVVETMRWPNASYSVSSSACVVTPSRDAVSRSIVEVQLEPVGLLIATRRRAARAACAASSSELRRPLGELVGIGVLERVLVLRAADARVDL